MKMNECSCGCGGMNGSCEKMMERDPAHYMFFGNLRTIQRNVEKMLSLDPEKVDQILRNGHDWANDHIATSKDDIEEVMNFLVNERPSREHSTMDKGLAMLPFVKKFESFTLGEAIQSPELVGWKVKELKCTEVDEHGIGRKGYVKISDGVFEKTITENYALYQDYRIESFDNRVKKGVKYTAPLPPHINVTIEKKTGSGKFDSMPFVACGADYGGKCEKI